MQTDRRMDGSTSDPLPVHWGGLSHPWHSKLNFPKICGRTYIRKKCDSLRSLTHKRSGSKKKFIIKAKEKEMIFSFKLF